MYVRVEVYPGAKKEKVSEVGENRLEIWVKAPAERNLANQRVKEILADKYQKRVAEVRIVSGHHSSRKIFSIDDEELLG